jgi:protein-disulfide isomerase
VLSTTHSRRLTQIFGAFLLAAALGCHAQVPPPGAISPELARRVEILIRSRSKLPPDYVLRVGQRTPSEVPGFDRIKVSLIAEGAPSKPISFLLSTDGKTLAQLSKYDISQDPKSLVSGAGRPARGGAEGAPVEIVAFDDLECPFCTKMHSQLFPALTDRYGSKVRIVYKDFPLPMHPWAMRAAVDANCVGAQSPAGYWNMVDYIHAHAADFGGADKSLDKAKASLDQLAIDEAKKEKLPLEAVQACVKKQDETAVKASMKVGDDLGIDATPVLFINGEKLEGAYPLVDVFRMVDGALVAAGQTAPPPYVPPTPPAVKPGS